MKQRALNLLFLANHILLIIYMSWQANHSVQLKIESVTPLLIVSLMLIDISYISSCNIRSNKVLSLFCGVLALDCWYMLLLLDTRNIAHFIFTAISPIMWYVFIKFILMFLFQGGGYRFRKTVNVILLVACIGTLMGLFISSKVFAGLYGIQWLVNICCLLFVVIYHRKRAAFVLKSEWKYIVVSAVVVAISFLAYYFATAGISSHLSNFGIYLPVLLFFISVHGIMLNEHNSFPLSTIFSRKQIVLIICSVLAVISMTILFLGGGYVELLISINILFAAIYICNIVLAQNLKNGTSSIAKESGYNAALHQLQQEEILKSDFANFLHDDILQDLLAIKNMMNKAHRPDIQDIIIETLDGLNTHIRQQMQDYHPVILKNLTVKENYQNLIESVAYTFPHRSIAVSFDCSDSLFLVAPYNVLIYRLLKELLTNVYKHSNGSRTWITLSQEKGIINLSVSDNGTAVVESINASDERAHKGLASIKEQINHIGGTITFSNNTPNGICVQIIIPMKGDVSYQYFIS